MSSATYHSLIVCVNERLRGESGELVSDWLESVRCADVQVAISDY